MVASTCTCIYYVVCLIRTLFVFIDFVSYQHGPDISLQVSVSLNVPRKYDGMPLVFIGLAQWDMCCMFKTMNSIYKYSIANYVLEYVELRYTTQVGTSYITI